MLEVKDELIKEEFAQHCLKKDTDTYNLLNM